MFNRDEFEKEKKRFADEQNSDAPLQNIARDFIAASDRHNYAYQQTWLGLPIIQLPADILMLQEIIWANKPDVIVETGIAWGGSVVLSASILELIGKGEVVAIDLNLMDHVSKQIMSYNFFRRISLYKGSSTDEAIVAKVKSHIKDGQTVMVILDSNHTHEHVLGEMRAYAPLVTKGQYLIVGDTHVEDFDLPHRPPRPWGKGNNPKTAMREFLQSSDAFEIDRQLEKKLLTTFMPEGYLRRIK
jgi:cephalosporin hydroxylase